MKSGDNGKSFVKTGYEPRCSSGRFVVWAKWLVYRERNSKGYLNLGCGVSELTITYFLGLPEPCALLHIWNAS